MNSALYQTSNFTEPQRSVQESITNLMQEFNNLKENIVQCLKRREISFHTVIVTLRSLPADVNDCKHFTESHLSAFSEAVEHAHLFHGTLSSYMNFLSYQLLDYFIHEFHLEEVKAKLKDYTSDLQQFKKRTSITQFSQARQSPSYVQPPLNFEKAVCVFPLSDAMKVNEVDQFQKEYSDHYKLKDYTMIFAKAEINLENIEGIVITWFIPESIKDNLLRAKLPRQILKKYSIAKLEIAGGCVYELRKRRKVRLTSCLSKYCDLQ